MFNELNSEDHLRSAQEFQQSGFIIFRNQFDPESCQLIANEVESVHQNFSELKMKVPALHKLGEWSIKNPHLVSAQIRRFFLSEQFREISFALIGPDVDLYWATTAAKPAEKGKSFPWHQDVGYEEDPKDYITCWSALDFVDEENGCLWAIPGSHQWPIQPHEFRKSTAVDYAGVFVKSVDFDESSKVPLQLVPGDVVCMHSRLMHRSYGNSSQRKRRGLISAFGPALNNHPKHIRGHEEAQEVFLRDGQIVDKLIADQ